MRHFARGLEQSICGELADTLAVVGAIRMIVGHTQVKEGTVKTRCNGTLLMADTIISKSAYPWCWEPDSIKTRGCKGSLSFVEIGEEKVSVVEVPLHGHSSIESEPEPKTLRIALFTILGGALSLCVLLPGFRNRFSSSSDRILLTKEDLMGHNEYLLKFVLVGDSGVGKSSLVRLFAGEDPLEELHKTEGMDYRVVSNIDVSIDADHRTAKLQLWDCSGDPKYEHITTKYFSVYYPILVFSLTCQNSFDSLQSRWLPAGQGRWPSHRVRLLVGTKLDDTSEVLQELPVNAQRLADEHGWTFVQLTVKTDPTRALSVLQAFAREARRDFDARMVNR